MISVFLHANLAPGLDGPSDGEDAPVAGTYRIDLADDTAESERASAALDGFHSRVPVGVLDDFEFRVFDQAGNPLVPDDGIDGYALKHKVLDVKKISWITRPTDSPAIELGDALTKAYATGQFKLDQVDDPVGEAMAQLRKRTTGGTRLR